MMSMGFFNAMGIATLLMFLLIMGVFVVTLVRGIGQWNKNNHSPVLTVDASVVSKWTDVRVHHSGERNHTHSSTAYYAAFQVESGDRIVFSMSSPEYGLLAEGDVGKLTFQGTRYQGFVRK